MFVEKLSNTRQVALGRLFIAALAILLLSASAQAGFITIDPAGMNAIFSQESFGDTPISIRFDPAIQIVAPQLLVINTPADEQALLNLAPDPAPTVDAFFVDQINRCDQTEIEHYGCAQLPGHILWENSTAAELDAAVLMAHELGHNLDLLHFSSGLMSFFLPHGTELFDFQVEKILESPLLQTDPDGQKFITIRPIAIVGAPVTTPEPSTLLLLSAALGALLIANKNKIRARLTK
jgi:hypothetical protein